MHYGKDNHIRNIVLELPPAPAALVLVGLAFAALSARSAAAFLLIAVFGPPGGEMLRPLVTVPDVEGEAGEEGRGEDCRMNISTSIATLSVALSTIIALKRT